MKIVCPDMVLKVNYDNEEGMYWVTWPDGSSECMNPMEFERFLNELKTADCALIK